MSETAKRREVLSKYCKGYGLDIGYGGDPIKPSAITVDMPQPYTSLGDHPLNLGGDARDLFWFKNNVLDYVYSSHCLEDFENTQEVAVEWLRVLKKDGVLVLLLPDQKRYEAHCEKAGTIPNQAHKIKNFSLQYLKKIISDIPYAKIIYEKDLLDDYGFEIVVKKIT
jgi:predicted SAM-dependent methyltransferase